MTTVPNPPSQTLAPNLLTYITNHATAVVPLTNLAGVLLVIQGEETLIANDQPAPGYLLLFLDAPPPPITNNQ